MLSIYPTDRIGRRTDGQHGPEDQLSADHHTNRAREVQVSCQVLSSSKACKGQDDAQPNTKLL